MKNIHSVILAAGLSRRMGSCRTNKVCLELLGKPVICRAIEALRSDGITSHTVVIGACAAEVIESLKGKYSNLTFAYQSGQNGPADAFRCGVESLPENLSPDTLILLTPGHRIVSSKTVEKLLERYNNNGGRLITAELAPQGSWPGQMLSIALGKLKDIKAGFQLFAETTAALLGSSASEFTIEKLAALINGNAAADAVVVIDDIAEVAGFNNPAEFVEIAELLRSRELDHTVGNASGCCRKLGDFIAALADKNGSFVQTLARLYGAEGELLQNQIARIRELLEKAVQEWGMECTAAIIRSPGRVNIMGRHVDHQGGNCNLMTIGCETLMVVRRRSDDVVTLQNLNCEFAPAEFSIGELVRDLPWDDWRTLVGSKKLSRLLKQYGVNWSDYIKAVFLRFQKHFCDHRLCGMDMIVSGNVPMAAGLSSSSTLVVAAAEAVVELNRLDLESDKLVELCGEGEWFVGTRGGAADHAAVKLGERNKVVKVGFFDFKVEKMVDFPGDYTLIVANSNIQARKSGNAKDQFNHRVSCYRIGFMLLKKFYPQYAARLHHLRDFNCENLGIPLDWLYTLLLQLPERATRQELEKLLPAAELEVLWNNHSEKVNNGIYPIRGVVLFGLAECERSRRFVDLLEARNMAEAGLMMNISHNGDRVMRFDKQGKALGSYSALSDDEYLQQLIADLRSGDPVRAENAQLWRQSGSYQCSLPEIDCMVDIALNVPGVAGAQLAGAGLGGCMMILVKTTAVPELEKALEQYFYVQRNSRGHLLACRPIAGAGAIELS